MTKPKTYGEFADQMQDVHIDERVRDREIIDDAWQNWEDILADLNESGFEL